MHVKIAYLDGTRLRRCVIAGAQWVIARRRHLDDINVFPVPDSDTGTNLAELIVTEVSPAPGVHGGPGTAGIAFMGDPA